MPTILVVDDEELVRKCVITAISCFGEYKILEAHNPEAALKIAEHDRIDLLVSDCVMQTKTSGPDLAKRMTALDSRVKVILMSGFENSDTLRLEQSWRFLHKPFLLAVLRAAIIELLGDPRDGGHPKQTGVSANCQ